MDEGGSSRPRAVRRRLRAKTKRLEASVLHDIEVMYHKPVEEWDWEELAHGRPRNDDGSFSSAKPKWITPAITAEAKRRMRLMTEEQVMVHADDAVRVLSMLMTNDRTDEFGKLVVPASVKLQAAQYVLNQIMGTPKARIEFEDHNPLAELMGAILVNPDGTPSHKIIEGSVVEEDDE